MRQLGTTAKIPPKKKRPRQSPRPKSLLSVQIYLASTPATMTTTPGAATTREPAAMLRTGAMPGLAHMALPIPGLIPLEVVERPVAAPRHRSGIAMPRVIPVIDMPVEPMPAVKPRPSADEQPAGKPVRPIVPIRRAVVRRIVVISVRARRRHTDPNHNLCRSHRTPSQ